MALAGNNWQEKKEFKKREDLPNNDNWINNVKQSLRTYILEAGSFLKTKY